MCCEDDLLPPVVRDMIAGYRALHGEHGHDWGDDYEMPPKALRALISWCGPGKVAAMLDQMQTVLSPQGGSIAEFVELVVRALPDPLPTGLATGGPSGLKVRSPLPFVAAGLPVHYRIFTVGAPGTVLTMEDKVVAVDDPILEVKDHRVRAAEPVATGRIRLVSDAPSRWSVVDERGGAWFPKGALRKYDYHGRPFFHGNHITLEVPVGRTTVHVGRGCEFQPVSHQIDVRVGEDVSLTLSPTRLYDAAKRGWFGGDLHVHMNYSGDQVCTPSDVSLMQQGESLHVMNLVAANWNTALIYDKEAFEHFVGQDLPWTRDDAVASWGIEYRNDLLGHFTALNLSAPPTRYQTGHPRSDEPQDWPPNAVAAAECRDRGATVSYTHPLEDPLGKNDSIDPVFSGHGHDCQARELVADAALGLVDSVDLTGAHNERGTNATEYLYHRLLGCGLRLAATAGTDVMLSMSRREMFSNPPGWARAYANLGGKPLSIGAWQDAVRAGKTFATTGPWLELDVDGRGVGDTVSLAGPAPISITARVTGVGVEQIELVGPDGIIASRSVPPDSRDAILRTHVEVTGPMWIAAIVRGGRHPDVIGPNVYAHTSPVWVNVAGETVARSKDAAWCLDWIDRFEQFARDVGTFTEPEQLQDLVDVLDEARAVYREITARSMQ